MTRAWTDCVARTSRILPLRMRRSGTATGALILGLLLSLSPVAGAAQSVQESIVAQLQAQGFNQIRVERTWLGRVRIVALSPTLERELVFNPQSGEILRDFWVGRDEGPTILDPTSRSGASGGDEAAREAREDRREDRQEAREDRREDRQDAREERREDRQEAREERQERREDRREEREDRREDREERR